MRRCRRAAAAVDAAAVGRRSTTNTGASCSASPTRSWTRSPTTPSGRRARPRSRSSGATGSAPWSPVPQVGSSPPLPSSGPSSSLLPCLHEISRQYASSHTRAQPALPPHKRGRDLFLRPTPAGGDAPGSEGARVLIHGSAATSPGTG